MGSYFAGIPYELAGTLARKYSIKSFIETGTYKGMTSKWASGYFESVFTIEGSEELFNISAQNLSALENVRVYKGDSKDFLSKIIDESQPPRMFWLDAHFTGGVDSFGNSAQCPLLKEISLIPADSEDNWILIDDARLFTGAPESIYDLDQWPTLHKITETIEKIQGSSELLIWADVIISPPKKYFYELRDIISHIDLKNRRSRREILNNLRKDTIMLIKYRKNNNASAAEPNVPM